MRDNVDMRVVMIGADRSVHGGVSAVVNNYYKEKLYKKTDLKYIGTMVDGSKARKLFRAVSSYLRFLIELPRMDILHVNMAADASFYRKKIFIDTAYFFHKRILIHEHGGDFENFYYKKSNDKGRRMISKTLNKAQIFVALSKEWADFFAPIADKTKIMILENAVPLYDSAKTSYEDHSLLFLGRLCREKGIAELFEAVGAAAKEYPDIKLYLGGVWEDNELKKQADKLGAYVEYLGWIDEKQKELYMEKASVFVLPSYFEGQPVSLLEAMSKGMAVISTNVGGILQIVDDRINGRLIPPKDVGALTDAVTELLGDNETKKRYGIDARTKIENRYNMKDRVDELVKIYESMMKQSGMKQSVMKL